MFSKFSSLFALAAAAPALAGIFVTQPVQGTTWAVGTPVTVQWQDDGSSPDLKTIGVSDVAIYTGNQFQQTLLQDIGTLDVSVNNSISFQVTPTIGPSNQAVYFIRFTAATLPDPTNAAAPYEAFSAKFSLSGATGTFNSTIQAQIDGISSAAAASVAPVTITSVVQASSPATSAKASASASGSSTAKANVASPSASTSGSAPAPRAIVPALFFAAGSIFAFLL